MAKENVAQRGLIRQGILILILMIITMIDMIPPRRRSLSLRLRLLRQYPLTIIIIIIIPLCLTSGYSILVIAMEPCHFISLGELLIDLRLILQYFPHGLEVFLYIYFNLLDGLF